MRTHSRAFHLGLCLIISACGRPPSSAPPPEINEALGKDGVQRFCGLGRPLRVKEAMASIIPRFVLWPDGRLTSERVLLTAGASPRIFAAAVLPGVNEARWRGGGAVIAKVTRIPSALVMAERGFRAGAPPPWIADLNAGGFRPRQAVRIQMVTAGRGGPAQVVLPCASVSAELTAAIAPEPGWPLEVALAASALRDRHGELPEDQDPIPVGVPEARDPTSTGSVAPWCAFRFEFDSFALEAVRVLDFAAGAPRVTEISRVGQFSTAPPALALATDAEGSPFYIDTARATRTEGWFRPCADAHVRGLVAEVAF